MESKIDNTDFHKDKKEIKVPVLRRSVVSDFGNPMSCSPPDSSAHGIIQARILEWVAISYSRGYSKPRD